ncbi:hypothetical protein Tco_1522762 [Tanacetum coccineum]
MKNRKEGRNGRGKRKEVTADKKSVIQEFMNDALDSALDSDDMEDEIDEELDRVLIATYDSDDRLTKKFLSSVDIGSSNSYVNADKEFASLQSQDNGFYERGFFVRLEWDRSLLNDFEEDEGDSSTKMWSSKISISKINVDDSQVYVRFKKSVDEFRWIIYVSYGGCTIGGSGGKLANQ